MLLNSLQGTFYSWTGQTLCLSPIKYSNIAVKYSNITVKYSNMREILLICPLLNFCSIFLLKVVPTLLMLKSLPQAIFQSWIMKNFLVASSTQNS